MIKDQPDGQAGLRILLTGPTGQVGWELARALSPLGPVISAGRTDPRQPLDLADPDRIRAVVRAIEPDLIVNAGAYTAVDRAEGEPELAHAVNGIAPGVLAEEARRVDAALVHYSTDYVFDGSSDAPYTEADVPAPVNAYGASKLAGERAAQAVGGRVLVLRTSWVYGLRGNNFLLTMRRLAAERSELRIVDDQIASPTWCRMIAESTAAILAREGPDAFRDRGGLYHLAAAGEVSWCGFAQAIFALMSEREERATPTVTPIPTDAYPTPAQRPLHTRLDCRALAQAFGIRMPPWHDALRLCMEA